MTYKQLIDTLTDLIDNHKLINQWGYGNLSDIETPETGAPNYPYMFINPVQVSIETYGFDVTLNLITMDQPLEGVEHEIDAASRTLGLIQDIISKFKLTTLYAETDVNLSVTCTPFKERFKDSVIGNTAIVTFQIEAPLDACDDPIVFETLLVHAVASQDYLISPEVGTVTPPLTHALIFDDIVETDGKWLNNYRYETSVGGTYKIVADYQMTLETPIGSQQIGDPPRVQSGLNGVYTFIEPNITTGWPTTFVDTSTVYTVHQEWTITVPDGSIIEFVRARNSIYISEVKWIEKEGSEIKIYTVS